MVLTLDVLICRIRIMNRAVQIIGESNHAIRFITSLKFPDAVHSKRDRTRKSAKEHK